MNEATVIRSVGIVIALAAEARALTPHAVHPDCITPLADGAGLWLSGMGPIAARRAAQALVDAGATALAIFGVAGALQTDLRSGTLVCPERIVDDKGADFLPDPIWRTRLLLQLAKAALPAPETGTLLSMPTPLLTPTVKTAMRDRHAAIAVDMESAAVAEIARDYGLPFVALRAIIDELHDTVPAALHASVDAWGRPLPLGLIAALSRHPSLLIQLPDLHGRMSQALRTLRAVAEATSPTLGWDK
ncbi:phosphorylase family protein [Rhodanobacter koreensis]